MHSRWALFLQKLNFLFKHKKGEWNIVNIVADALSRRVHLLIMVKVDVTQFEE